MSNQRHVDRRASAKETTSETETEPETDLPVTKDDIQRSRAWKIGNLKPKG